MFPPVFPSRTCIFSKPSGIERVPPSFCDMTGLSWYPAGLHFSWPVPPLSPMSSPGRRLPAAIRPSGPCTRPFFSNTRGSPARKTTRKRAPQRYSAWHSYPSSGKRVRSLVYSEPDAVDSEPFIISLQYCIRLSLIRLALALL